MQRNGKDLSRSDGFFSVDFPGTRVGSHFGAEAALITAALTAIAKHRYHPSSKQGVGDVGYRSMLTPLNAAEAKRARVNQGGADWRSGVKGSDEVPHTLSPRKPPRPVYSYRSMFTPLNYAEAKRIFPTTLLDRLSSATDFDYSI